MAHAKRVLMAKRNRKTIALLGTAGLTLALAGGISAATAAPVTDTSTRNAVTSHEITLGEEEISDVSLATHYGFDHEHARTVRRGIKFSAGGCGCSHG
jgi:hypothetical protein